jgi:Domain of unknown function (DUF1998)
MKQNKKPPGEIRRSQILSTYGPGAMVDLPNHAVVIGGLNYWSSLGRTRIYEDRLAAKVGQILQTPPIAMYTPPVDVSETGAKTGITTFTFPTWFVAQVNETYMFAGREYRTRPLVPYGQLEDKGKRFKFNNKKVPVVPVRFVQSCVNGHLHDIDWRAFVHERFDHKCFSQLYLDEGGSGNDFAEIYVRCEACKKRRALGKAKIKTVLGPCPGSRPWLGPDKLSRESCLTEKGAPEYAKLLVRSASNSYFSQTLSVISIPDTDAKVKEAVDMVWEDFLMYVEDFSDLHRERRKQKVAAALEGLTDEAIWKDMQRRRGGANGNGGADKSIKQVEIETLLSSPVVGEDKPESDFYATARDLKNLEPGLAERIDRIVLVHRLREVIALVGFTRFESSMPDIDGELDLGVCRAALDLEPNWVPAVENKGEGVFISFKKSAIDAWNARDEVKAREKALKAGFEVWCRRRGLPDAEFPKLPYIMLHSLSHLLITAVSLECGYAATSIRERVYAGEGGYGILLFTGSSGSEGTLGGLVQVGEHLEDHLKSALEQGQLCSNDPGCAQHEPTNPQEERFLHGAACHGCLLIGEPSCERGNEYLDRALVVPTVEGLGAEFFFGDSL